jgi:cyclase
MASVDPKINKIKDRVFVVTETGSCNIGVCVSGKAALVIDSGYRPDVSARVVELIERELDARIEHLFNTHYHADHTFGNQAFACPILASRECADRMQTCLTTYWHPDEIKKEMAEDPEINKAWRDLRITFPTETFSSEMNLDFHGLHIVFKKVGGHTPDSSVAFLPEQKTVFIGDIVFGGMYPTLLTDGDPIALIAVLREFIEGDLETFISGHGTWGGREILTPLVKYWTCLLDEGQKVVNTEADHERLVAHLLERCRIEGIPYVEHRHRRNIESIIHYLTNNPE